MLNLFAKEPCMTLSPLALLHTRRLGPLAVAAATGAFNDNLVKAAMLSIAIFRLDAGGAGLSALAGALFIAPYALLSATAGQIADRFSKPRVILAVKIAETPLMAAAALAFLTESVHAMLAVLLGLGVQAAVFGPVKYGVLPEHLAEDELIAGNGAIEACTFLSIVAGTVMGGGLALREDGPAIVGSLGIAVSLLGGAAATRLPASAPADSGLRIGLNPVAETRIILRGAAAHRPIWLSILGLSWFWTVGATLMTEFPVIVRDTIHASGGVLTLLLAVFAIGVGLGSIGCATLLRGQVSPRFVPWAGLGISVFLWDFAGACSAAGAPGGPESAAAMVGSVAGLRMLIDLVLLAACGGLFSVPLYALMQDRADPRRRSRIIAANNVMNAAFIVAGAAAAAGLAALRVEPPGVLTIAAMINLGVAAASTRLRRLVMIGDVLG
jgi:acyl-[acyl-carrier-protein]-phospholipid O-acyltransferase/long-chain-fatty-acid--[acyl-carrier-protein] ligase